MIRYPAERYGDPEENHRERKRTRSYSKYVALLCDFINKEPSNYEEVTEWKEWKDAMIEGCCPKTKREVSCNFQMDLQDQACYRW